MESIAAVIATALALGASEGLKDTAAQAIKDAYEASKDTLINNYRLPVDDPDSEPRKAVVEQDLARTGADKDEEVIARTKELIEAVRTRAPEAAAALHLTVEDLQAAEVQLVIQAGSTNTFKLVMDFATKAPEDMQKDVIGVAGAIATEMDVLLRIVRDLSYSQGKNFFKIFPIPSVKEDFRKEDYFSVYNSHLDRIGEISTFLSPKIVESIVSFYGYMKISRDQFGLLIQLDNEKQSDLVTMVRDMVENNLKNAVLSSQKMNVLLKEKTSGK
jgi:hypothetical protein